MKVPGYVTEVTVTVLRTCVEMGRSQHHAHYTGSRWMVCSASFLSLVSQPLTTQVYF
jgi:hypothetical protein